MVDVEENFFQHVELLECGILTLDTLLFCLAEMSGLSLANLIKYLGIELLVVDRTVRVDDACGTDAEEAARTSGVSQWDFCRMCFRKALWRFDRLSYSSILIRQKRVSMRSATFRLAKSMRSV